MILEAMGISIKVVLISLLITFSISIVILRFQDKSIMWKVIEYIIITPMFIPPSAVGYIILVVLGRNGLIGKILVEKFNISVIFTITAAVIAAIIVTLPIMYQSIKAAFSLVDEEVKNAARIDGASEFKVFTNIILPLSRRGILTGILLSFARAFGEFGATILVAGNIPGKTQTIPMAMYYAIENNDSQVASEILIIVFIIAIILINIYTYLTTKSEI